MSRPLLVIDGDSFAHRAFHGLPKTIRRRGDKGGGAIVGFANFLLRLYLGEEPRAVIVGWDTLDAPTYRHEAFSDYQSGRQFDPELVDQLEVLPQLVAACGFANAKAPGYEADDFLALRGDPSDKLPGARGIGPKGAASLLRKYGSLEEALAKGRFPAQAEALRTYRRIATMNASAPLPALGDQTPTWAKAAALAQEWELTRLADRLAELARTP